VVVVAGWRAMFWLAVPVAVAAAILMRVVLPKAEPTARLSYPSLLASILRLWVELPALRLAAITQASLFAAFTTFWTILTFRLAGPDFALGADVAGLFGLVGLVGVIAAPIAGRRADRHGPEGTILLGAICTLVAWIVFGLWGTVAGLVVGVILLDFGIQIAVVSNQHVIYALRPEARSRVNTVFMGTMFLGGALGSAAATQAWSLGGWTAVVTLGIGCGGFATLLQSLRRW
jgi:predicted MFS family arabinose efflux permease